MRDIPTKPTVAYEYDMHQPLNMEGGPPLPPEGSVLVTQPQVKRSGSRQQLAPITPTSRSPRRGRVSTRSCGRCSSIRWIVPAELRSHGFHHPDRIDPADPSFEAPSMIIGKQMNIANAQTSPAMFAQAIRVVRELISDTNPDRNYHFRPPTPGKVVANYTTRVGFIWLDTTILVNLATVDLDAQPLQPDELSTTGISTRFRMTGATSRRSKLRLCASAVNRPVGRQMSSATRSTACRSTSTNQRCTSRSRQTYQQQFNTLAPLVTANRPFSRWSASAALAFGITHGLLARRHLLWFR
jgi:hypothetical protein